MYEALKRETLQPYNDTKKLEAPVVLKVHIIQFAQMKGLIQGAVREIQIMKYVTH